MRRVMDEYLLPAGYEIQKAQYDYQRIMEGKALFDRGSVEALKACSNNNERYDLLLKLDEYVIPNYDDLAGVFPDIKSALLETLAAAQTTPTQPIETPFGNLAGKSADDIARLVITIFDKLRHIDVEGSFSAFLEMLKSEQNHDRKKDILGAIERLAHYDLNVIRQVGYGVQDYLSERLDRLPLPDLLAQLTVALTVWREVLSPEFSGVSSSHDKVTLTSGSLNPAKGLAEIRGRAINGLFKILGVPEVSAADRRTTITILGSTGRLPNQSNFSYELCRMVLGDRKTVTDRMAEYIADLPYDLQETIEEELLFEYRRAKELAENEKLEELLQAGGEWSRNVCACP